MPPAFTGWPPYTFTPRRLALLSRPFLVDPPPFLCAASICRGPGASRAGLGLACCCSLEPHLKLLCVEFRDMPCNAEHSMMLGRALRTSGKTYSKLCYTLQRIVKLRGLLRGRA